MKFAKQCYKDGNIFFQDYIFLNLKYRFFTD